MYLWTTYTEKNNNLIKCISNARPAKDIGYLIYLKDTRIEKFRDLILKSTEPHCTMTKPYLFDFSILRSINRPCVLVFQGEINGNIPLLIVGVCSVIVPLTELCNYVEATASTKKPTNNSAHYNVLISSSIPYKKYELTWITLNYIKLYKCILIFNR